MSSDTDKKLPSDGQKKKVQAEGNEAEVGDSQDKWAKRWAWLKSELRINKQLLPIKGVILLFNMG